MAKKKADQKPTEVDDTQDEVQDQPERDIFDEDEADEQGPPQLPPGHPDSAVGPVVNQDATGKPQDATGDVPTILKDESTQADPGRVPGDGETAANQALLDTKGDLQPIQDQKDGLARPGHSGVMNDQELRAKIRQELLDEMKASGVQATTTQPSGRAFAGAEPGDDQGTLGAMSFKVARGMVGAFPEGAVIPNFKSMNIQASDLQRLLEAGVIVPFKAEDKS